VERSVSSNPSRSLAVAALPVAICVLGYFVLCMVVLHRPGWVLGTSILAASFVGPPHWLVWGLAARPIFWGCSAGIAVIVGVGAIFRPLLLPSAALCVAVWLGAGFLSVAMSI